MGGTQGLFDEVITIDGSPAEVARRLIAYDLEEHTEGEDEQVAEQMAALSLDEQIAIASAVLDAAQAEYRPVATLGCYSGGNDSTTFMHLFRDRIDHAVHINTGIGIDETREFVRATCAAWGVPLIEKSPPPGCTYREMVLKHGFPGPAQHPLVFTRLKERALRLVRKDFIGDEGRTKRVLFLSGMRRFESDRRFENTQMLHRDGAAVWCSPIGWWTTDHLAEYRQRHEIPKNEVSEHLHMSGECLCGCYAKPGELEQLRFFYPDKAAEIEALQDEVRALGLPSTWGVRPDGTGSWTGKAAPMSPLCAKCVGLWDDDSNEVS